MSRCIVCQTIDVAKATDRLEDLCRWYASEISRLQQARTPDGDPQVAVEIAGLRRAMARLNETIAERNAEIERLRKGKR